MGNKTERTCLCTVGVRVCMYECMQAYIYSICMCEYLLKMNLLENIFTGRTFVVLHFSSK